MNSTDPTTTAWMSSMIGKSHQFSVSANARDHAELLGRPNFSISRVREADFQPEDVQGLRNGGEHNQFEVDSIVLLGAKAMQAIGRPWEKVVFMQRDDNAAGTDRVASNWVRKSVNWFGSVLWNKFPPVRLVRGVLKLPLSLCSRFRFGPNAQR